MQKFGLFTSVGLGFMLCLVFQSVNAQGFKGIIPMQSTCQDVRLILDGKGCGNSEEILVLSQEKIRIAYSTTECQQFYGRQWNIPIGTVVVIERTFKKSPTLAELGIAINESDYTSKTNDIRGQIIYSKKNGELELVVTHGYVNEIFYFPFIDNKTKMRKVSTMENCTTKTPGF
jgi:hypothetical protein